MGFMLLCSRKRSLADNMSQNPNKRIKLEFQNDGNVGNDDLWGQDDDITAEEFDRLEIQATQSCNQNCSLVNNNALQGTSLFPKSSTAVEVPDSKEHIYELEGRIKLLSLSLEKLTKELNEERMHRDRLIDERTKQFHVRETNLQKEVEKMQSILEFKEQEMKITYSRLQILKSQVTDKKSINADIPVNSNFEAFLKSSKWDEQSVKHNKVSHEKHRRKYKLSVDIPKGEMNGTEVLSSILCTRLAVPSFVNNGSITNSGYFANSSCSSALTPVTILHLKNEQKYDEILEYYCKFLENHVSLLKNLASKNNRVPFNKTSYISSKSKEAYSSQTVVSYLIDIAYIYSCPSFRLYHRKGNMENQSSLKSTDLPKSEKASSSCAQQNEEMIASNSTLSLLQSLSALSNPKIYPIGYHRIEEMELALSALLSVCLSCPEDFLALIGEFPCYYFSNPHESVSGLCTNIKLLTAVCPNRNFLSYLAHKDSSCIICLIANFLHVAVLEDPEKFAVSLILVEEFLSSMFSIYSYKETELSSSCISKVIQGIIKCLWKYLQTRENNVLSFQILKKGFLLLHFTSSNIPNFKENRNPVEDEYVSLLSGALAVSKENSELREFCDLIHNLWDFQTDLSEFDLDELPEEVHSCTNDADME